MLPPKLVTYFTVERLESACYICAAFLRAHRIARQQLHDFIGVSDVSSAVISESVLEGEEARKFLEDVRVTYPQVLRVVKTRQSAYIVLNHLIEYVQNLEKAGILEEKEMIHLHDAVQSTREMMKLHGSTLYKEGSKSNGIWLISNGVVKWESNTIRNRHSFNPTFTHGSTLGLYEVLTGRPYICDVIADSVVFCIFLDADKIISCLGSDPSVEDFLWQESVIFLSKLLLPQIFEKLAMPELRTIIAERSQMTIYIRGETIEIPRHSVAFLLEGYVKTHGRQELATAPAVLLPSHGNLSSQNLAISGIREASFSHQGSSYLVETRARVIVFNLTAFESDSPLVRRSSSRLSQAMDHSHRTLRSREHSGLMSWPEHFYYQQPKQHKQSSEWIGQQTNNLSTRAMQLSLYGSMVELRHQSRSLTSNQVRPALSQSYPTIVPHHGRKLVSVKSESAATAKNDHEVREFTQNVVNPPLQTTERREHHADDSSDDDSAAEEDVIVRIDSPSTLSFHQS